MRFLFLIVAGFLLASCGLSHGLDLPSSSSENDSGSFSPGDTGSGDGDKTNIPIANGDVSIPPAPGETSGDAASPSGSGGVGGQEGWGGLGGESPLPR